MANTFSTSRIMGSLLKAKTNVDGIDNTDLEKNQGTRDCTSLYILQTLIVGEDIIPHYSLRERADYIQASIASNSAFIKLPGGKELLGQIDNVRKKVDEFEANAAKMLNEFQKIGHNIDETILNTHRVIAANPNAITNKHPAAEKLNQERSKLKTLGSSGERVIRGPEIELATLLDNIESSYLRQTGQQQSKLSARSGAVPKQPGSV